MEEWRKEMEGYCVKEHFRDRLYGEYQAYNVSVLSRPNNEIFGRCHEIDTMENFYKILTEKAEHLPEPVIMALLLRRNLLKSIYESWLRNENYGYDDPERHVDTEIENIVKETGGWYIWKTVQSL